MAVREVDLGVDLRLPLGDRLECLRPRDVVDEEGAEGVLVVDLEGRRRSVWIDGNAAARASCRAPGGGRARWRRSGPGPRCPRAAAAPSSPCAIAIGRARDAGRRPGRARARVTRPTVSCLRAKSTPTVVRWWLLKKLCTYRLMIDVFPVAGSPRTRTLRTYGRHAAPRRSDGSRIETDLVAVRHGAPLTDRDGRRQPRSAPEAPSRPIDARRRVKDDERRGCYRRREPVPSPNYM